MHHARPPRKRRTARPGNTRSERERRKWAGIQGKISIKFTVKVNEETMSNFEHIPDILTIPELQKVLRIGRSTAYRLIKTSELRCIRIGRSIRIPREYVLEYIETQHTPSSVEDTVFVCENSQLQSQPDMHSQDL